MIGVVVEGGAVVAVVSTEQEDIERHVMVIDYDTDGADDSELTLVPQGDGTAEKARVWLQVIEEPAIGIRHLRAALESQT